MLLVLLLLLSQRHLVPASAAVCPGGEYATLGSKLYYWSAAAVRFDQATVGCPENSTLAYFEDSAEMDVLADKGVDGAYVHTLHTGCLAKKKKERWLLGHPVADLADLYKYRTLFFSFKWNGRERQVLDRPVEPAPADLLRDVLRPGA